MPRKSKEQARALPMVTFNCQDRTYQIDTERRKVYRRFVEIETSKAVEIFALWRAENVSV